ncbi:hypothetical protein ACFX4N_23780 [Priestia sp. YIM B13551]|uniref:hypothetical protein n=1 Tax=Priestia sp. YIM B13551 TaxID=3366306 RepID=UPI0036726218
MDEKDLYGNKLAIDTDTERSILEYRPRFKYEPNKPITVNLTTEENIIDEPDEEVAEGNAYVPVEKPAQQYEDFVDTVGVLDEMIQFVQEEVKDVVIPLSEQEVITLYESFPYLDPTIAHQGGIDFTTYDETFADPDAPSNVLIQDFVHSHASDVDGSLELEVYEDLKELQLTVQEGYYFYKESVLKNYLDGDIPVTPSNNEELTKQIDEAVQKQREQLEDITKSYKESESAYYEALRNSYGTPEFFDISNKYMQAKRSYDIAIRENKTLQEMMSLVDTLLLGTEDCSNYIKSGLVLGSGIDGEEVMKVLDKQATTKEELAELMKLTQLSLKLQVNSQIEDKKQYRDVLKNINNLSRKQRAHDELLTAFELRNKMYLKTYDVLQNLESPSKEKGVESFLNQMAGGLNLVQDQYDSFLRDVYLMYTSEYEVRKEKLTKTLDKEDARAGYSLVLDHL